MIPLLKRIFCFVLVILIPIALFPVPAFAVDPVSFTEAETLGAVIVDLYGAYNNTSLAYQNFSDGSALTEIVTLYNEYSQSASDPYTLAAIGAAAVVAGTIAVIYDAVTGKGYIQLYQEQYVSSLDGFWDYTLNDLGFLRDSDGNFVWVENNGVIDSVSLVYVDVFPLLPVTSSSRSDILSSGVQGNSGSYFSSSSSGVFIACTSGYKFYSLSDSSSPVVYRASPNNSTVNSYSSWSSYHGFYYQGMGNTFSSSPSSGIPVYSSLGDLLDAFENRVSLASSIDISPSVYIGDPLENPESIEYPDPSSPDYAPRPVTIQTNVEWDDDWGSAPEANPTPGVPYPITDPATLNNLVPDLWSQIVAGTASVEAPQPDPSPDDPSGGTPSEVFIPLLPVTLPDFDFSLSGIWHYVVTWVQSLGSWLTMMFTVWNSLPYAMVVPVYATAVIVIVLGVYKRFFM